MNTKIARFGLIIGALAAVIAGPGTALAQNHGGGGGHSSGGHASSGGGSAHGGGRSYGGGGYAGRGYGGGYPGHAYGYAGGARGFVGGQHFSPSGRGGYAGGYGHGGGGYAHGGGGFYHGPYWGGGYWHGGYWPRAWYGPGFAWFLPILPLAYATYWWGDVPYYYANDVYYTWNPSYSGYVATDPPPVSDGSVDGGGGPAVAGPAAAGAQIYMYPKNGQTDAQQATDRGECQQWASSQAGGGGNSDEYRRAMSACAEARGYSVK